VLAVSSVIGAGSIDHHPRERKLAMLAVRQIRDQINAAPPGADVYIKNERFNGVGPLMLERPIYSRLRGDLRGLLSRHGSRRQAGVLRRLEPEHFGRRADRA